MAPAAAHVLPHGYIRGTVTSPNGFPALGVCVHHYGPYVIHAEADGGFEMSVSPGTYEVVFVGCVANDDVYPYETLWWRNATTWEDATGFEVAAGQTVTLNVVLPLKPDGPPEFGGIEGHVTHPDGESRSRVAILADASGDTFAGIVDDTGYYHVAAPPGNYRLLTVNPYSDRDQYLLTFYGDHPRGYAAAWDEAEIITIPTSGQVEPGIDLAVHAGYMSRNPGLPTDTLGFGPPTEEDPLSFEYSVEVPNGYARVGIEVVGAEPHSLEDYRVLVYPALQESWPAAITLRMHNSVLREYTADTVPVWLEHKPVPACQPDAPVAPCIRDRYADPSGVFSDAATVEVMIEEGGIFTFGERPQFYDSESSMFGGDILWLADSGITRGCNPPVNNIFCPDDSVTRGQMAAFLVRALSLTDRAVDAFLDDDDSIFESDIEKLAAAGITKGCNPPANDQFCPDHVVTRGQMAAFLVRALSLSDSGTAGFVDDDGLVFESDIERLAAAGITRGCNPPINDQFCPTAVVTRGQMAAFLHRAVGK